MSPAHANLPPAWVVLPACGCTSSKHTPPTSAATPTDATTACAGARLALDAVRDACRIEGLVEPDLVAGADALELILHLEPPDTPGEALGVKLEAHNVSGAPLELDLALSEHSRPLALLRLATGSSLEPERDPACATPIGGLGAWSAGRRWVSRVRLEPGGQLIAEASLPTRRGWCTCDDEGEPRCAHSTGAVLEPGSYQVSASLPVAVVRTDGAGPYTTLWAEAPLQLR